LIIQGVLSGDEKLPSVRELATSLAINPNTIQRAYRELEQEGYVYTVPGKGSFVAGVPEEDGVRKRELLETLDKTVEELLFLGVSWGELVERIRKM
jgi:GntR family transcriptional regulator